MSAKRKKTDSERREPVEYQEGGFRIIDTGIYRKWIAPLTRARIRAQLESSRTATGCPSDVEWLEWIVAHATSHRDYHQKKGLPIERAEALLAKAQAHLVNIRATGVSLSFELGLELGRLIERMEVLDREYEYALPGLRMKMGARQGGRETAVPDDDKLSKLAYMEARIAEYRREHPTAKQYVACRRLGICERELQRLRKLRRDAAKK